MKGKARRTKANGPKEGRLEAGTIILMIVIVGTFGASFWMAVEGATKPYLDEFTRFAISSFVSLLIVPAVLLRLLTRPRWRDLGRFDLGFLLSFLAYQIFGLWILMFYWVRPDYFKNYDLGSLEFLSYLFFVALYVPPIDFVTKRFVQFEVARSYGKWTGFMVGFLAWIIVHLFEVIWLAELMGFTGSTLFVLTSGILTGLLYMRYKNVLAMMLGHWTINLLISIITSSSS